jgi:hypothetical protein
MHARVNRRGHATTTVRVSEIGPSDTDRMVLEVALVAASETRSSIWGWTCTRIPDDPTLAIVALHTD